MTCFKTSFAVLIKTDIRHTLVDVTNSDSNVKTVLAEMDAWLSLIVKFSVALIIYVLKVYARFKNLKCPV